MAIDLQPKGAEAWIMVIICKRCRAEVSLTERESAQIASDLDRRFSWEDQAQMKFEAVCAECWSEDEQEQRIGEALRAGRRVQFISATV